MKKKNGKIELERRMKIVWCPKSGRNQWGNYMGRSHPDSPTYRCCKCGEQHG